MHPTRNKPSRYVEIIERIFERHYQEGAAGFEFARSEIIEVAQELGIALPKNLGDLIYSFRYRAKMPDAIASRAPEGQEWVIRLAGRSRYRFALSSVIVRPNPVLVRTKVPDATPGVVTMYALTDEQALLAKLRYNRLIDIFTGVTCYSLQNHLRTTVAGMGQVETDEIYVGVDKRGIHYVLPIQAKSGSDRLSIVQAEQDAALCAQKFAQAVCRPIGAQFMGSDVIALFEFQMVEGEMRILEEKHYALVPPDDISDDDLRAYRGQSTAIGGPRSTK